MSHSNHIDKFTWLELLAKTKESRLCFTGKESWISYKKKVGKKIYFAPNYLIEKNGSINLASRKPKGLAKTKFFLSDEELSKEISNNSLTCQLIKESGHLIGEVIFCQFTETEYVLEAATGILAKKISRR